jgi:hypothetical protein
VDEQRVDHGARIVDRGVPQDPQRAGPAVDLDDGRVRAGGHRDVGAERHLGVKRVGSGRRDLRQRPPTTAEVRRDRARLLGDLVDRLRDRRAAHRERPAAERPDPDRRLGAVAEEQRHVIERDAEAVGGDLRERGVVALAVRRGARPDHDAPAGLDRDGGALEDAAGALDVQRGAGADDDPGVRAPLGLDLLEREVKAALVVAGVVRQAERARVRERADEVAPAQLDRVDAERPRRVVHGSLDEVVALRPPRAAVGPGRDLVGLRSRDLDRDVADVVAAAHQHRGGVRRDVGRGPQVGAEVGQDPRAHAQEAPVAVEGELHVGLHAAPLLGREQVLEAVLGPLHRPAQVDRRDRRDDRLGRRVALRAERAADVGDDDANRLRRAAEDVGELGERAVRVLRRAPHGQDAGLWVVARDCPARLDRDRRDPRHPVPAPDDVLGAREGGVGVAAGVPPADERVPRLARIDDRLERLVVHLDELREVLGQRAALGDDAGDRLAGVADLALGQDRVLVVADLHALDRDLRVAGDTAREVGGRDDREDAGRPLVRHAHVADAGVRVRAADERDVGHAVEVDVVDVARGAAQHALVLAARQGTPDVRLRPQRGAGCHAGSSSLAASAPRIARSAAMPSAAPVSGAAPVRTQPANSASSSASMSRAPKATGSPSSVSVVAASRRSAAGQTPKSAR